MLVIAFAAVSLGTESFAQDNITANNMTSQNQAASNQSDGQLVQETDLFSGSNIGEG